MLLNIIVNFSGMMSRPLMELYNAWKYFAVTVTKYLCNRFYMPQVGLLLLESLLLLGHFALFHPGNQAVLRWGKSPTILHKVSPVFTSFDLS